MRIGRAGRPPGSEYFLVPFGQVFDVIEHTIDVRCVVDMACRAPLFLPQQAWATSCSTIWSCFVPQEQTPGWLAGVGNHSPQRQLHAARLLSHYNMWALPRARTRPPQRMLPLEFLWCFSDPSARVKGAPQFLLVLCVLVAYRCQPLLADLLPIIQPLSSRWRGEGKQFKLL